MPRLTSLGRLVFDRAAKGVAPDPSSHWAVRLIKADFAEADDLSTGDVTESTFGGYAAVDFFVGDSADPVADGPDWKSLLHAAPFVWDCTSVPETVYGWVLYSTDEDDLLACERYGTPHVLEVGSRHTLYIDLKTTSP